MRRKSWLFCLFLIIPFFMCACGNKTVDIESYMSDCRNSLYVGENENVFTTLSSGVRENPYKYDGEKNVCVDFCIVSVWVKNNSLKDEYLQVELDVAGTLIDVTLEKSPYEEGYMADLGSQVASGQNVILKCEDLNCEINLNCVSKDWEIQSADALKIGETALAEKINKYYKNGKLLGECYLKIIYDKSREIKSYYWYFAFVSNDNFSTSCVIDVNNGAILAKI